MESLNNACSKIIMLMLTDYCNLRCRYCYEGNKKGKKLDFTVATQIIDQALSQPGSSEEMWLIEFFGGETMLAFPQLRDLFSYVQTKYPSIQKRFAFTTNGTLFTPESKAWFQENGSHFHCTISLDGTPEMHNLNRRTSDDLPTWDLIDLDFVRSVWPDALAKMTVTEETLPHLAQSIIFIDQLGLKCKITLASGVSWDADAYRELYHQLELLCRYYMEHPDRELCSILDLPIANLCYADTAQDIRFCDAGLSKTCFDMNGRAYPCQGLTPLAAGENSIPLSQWEAQLSCGGRCKDCRWLCLCPTCYAANLLESKKIFDCPSNICLMHRISILAASFVQFSRLEAKLDSGILTPQEEAAVQAAVIIQQELTKEPDIAQLIS